MAKNITPLQTAILTLAQTRDISKLSLRQLGSLVGDEHPYAVQLAKKALVREGRLIYNERSGQISLPTSVFDRSTLIQIPILGRVSCGVATELASEGPHSFLPVSPSMVNTKRWDDVFALVAVGDSMNLAQINKSTVDDGDYVIVRKVDGYTPNQGDYIVSRINDAYNLKKLHIDEVNRRIVLLSESTEEYMPIFIAAEDMEHYAIDGVAIDIVKGIGV